MPHIGYLEHYLGHDSSYWVQALNRHGNTLAATIRVGSTSREIAQAEAEAAAREAGYAEGYEDGDSDGRAARDAEIMAAVETKVEEVTDKSKRSRKKAD